MARQILFIRNPKAGSFRVQNSFLNAANVMFRSDCGVYVYSTQYQGDAARIVAEQGASYDLIVAFGGDGTLNEVINGVMQLENKPLLGYIPAGTTNDFAVGLGLSKDSAKAAQDVLEGEPFPLDVGQFNEGRYFSYVASFGSFTKASYSAPQDVKNALGYSAYLLEGIKSLSDFHPYHVRVRTEEREIEDDFIFGGASNALSMGGVIKLERGMVDLSDGLFEVLLIRKPKNLLQLQSIVHGLLTRQYDNAQVLFFKSKEVHFSCEGSFAWTVDGEFAGVPKEVRIRNCHHAVTIIRPRDKVMGSADKKKGESHA